MSQIVTVPTKFISKILATIRIMTGTNLGRIWVFILPLLSLISCDSDIDSYSSFSDVTNKIFGGPKNGTIAAFGDFNSDQHVDIFFIVNEGHGVEVFLTHSNNVRTDNADITRSNESITGVVPGDFDGDSHMDVLITTRPKDKALDKTAPTSAYVYWGPGLGRSSDDRPPTTVSTNMIDEPLVMDYNADMIPDLFGAEMDGKRYFWVYNTTISPYGFTKIPMKGDHSTDPFTKPSSHAFVDVYGTGYSADLVVTSMANDQLQYEVWVMHEGPETEPAWTFQDKRTIPEGKWAHVGQSTFADIDADGRLDHIVPVCSDDVCMKSYVYVMKGDEEIWTKVLQPEDLIFNSKQYGFIPPGSKLSNSVDIPLTIRAGDVNLDNYPDFVCILQQGSNGNRLVVVLQNYVGKVLSPAWPTADMANIKNAVLAAFVDVTNTGLLDVVVVSQQTPESMPRTHLLGNQFSIDAYFVTVQVLSGFVCSGDGEKCPNGKYPYGVNQPGPQIHYDTTSASGGRQKSIAAQLCQSSHFSLQLPHVVLGLGQNPNFVDYLTVGVPAPVGMPKQRQFTSVIPNSQLIVIPKPLDKPQDWTSKLLITPGQSVILTGAILIGTCLFIAIVAAVLQYLEKREDEIQKRQESHRFHFDAM